MDERGRGSPPGADAGDEPRLEQDPPDAPDAPAQGAHPPSRDPEGETVSVAELAAEADAADLPLEPPFELPISRATAGGMVAFYLASTMLIHYRKLLGSAVFAVGLIGFLRPLGRLLAATLVRAWQQINRAAEAERAFDPPGKVDLRVLVVLCTTAVALTLIEYFGDRATYGTFVGKYWPEFYGHRYYELSTYAYWTGARFLGYVVLPWLVALFMPGERLRDQGLSPRGFVRHLWIYGLLFLIVLPAVVMVSYTPAFQHTYPFYDLAGRSWFDLLAWEGLYGLQFFALEVFFRGFMIHPLRRSMGTNAVFCMAVPYCMIHYHKPLPEVLGAVVAGTVLGTLSLATGSIWCGVLIHVSVAWTMDGLSLAHTVGIPGRHTLVSG